MHDDDYPYIFKETMLAYAQLQLVLWKWSHLPIVQDQREVRERVTLPNIAFDKWED